MEHLTLVDGNSVMFRAYYATAYPGAVLMQTSQGVYTNAVFAFVNMMDKILEQTNGHILVAFDTAHPTKRHEKYQEYKAGRAAMPEELAQQIPLVKKYLDKAGIKQHEQIGYEADDIIGTLAKEASQNNIKVDVYSSDRDLLQLVDQNITVHLLKKGMKELDHYTPESLYEKYELTHHQMIDLKALMGDPSDNIPGIPGVGEKTAIKLLKEYETIENLYVHQDEIKGKMGEKIRENKELAYLSKDLVTINVESPLPFSYLETEKIKIETSDLIDFFKELELKQLVVRMANQNQNTLFKDEEKSDKKTDKSFSYDLILNDEKLNDIIFNHQEPMSIHFEFSEPNYHKAELWGIGLSNGENTYFIDPSIALNNQTFLNYLKNKEIEKYTFDYKAIKVFLMWHKKAIHTISFDMLLAAYLIKSSIGKEDFTTITSLFSSIDISYEEQIYGKGAKKGLPENKELYYEHIAKKASVIYKLKDDLLETLKDQNQLELLQKVEIPLSEVLASMEFSGLLVDNKELLNQKEVLEKRINVLEESIYKEAGETFNISSPKQLGDILFEKLNLSQGKKTKTGYSTNVEVLEKLKDEHPIIPYIMEYRQLAKLYSTYIIGISQSIFSDNKVHTIFNQALTTTGRLSSIEPNLQNIPIRTEEGRKIRKIFVAEKNHYLLGADYSQIELRVLADIANVKHLKESFLNNEDIHKSTAQKVFHVTDVTSEQRRQAKAVNFGIIYGIGAWSLAEDIHVSPKEAQMFIDRYLEIYPEIKQYMQDTVEFATENGYVKTLMNRRRYIPEINSKVFMQKEFGKRNAMNAPIQGSAADIIKVAMVDLFKYLEENDKKSKIILQVHDELILEVPEEELEEMKELVPAIMKKAVKLTVSLETSCDVGKNWYELK
ncbi:DNA polymerase I [Alteracholeplasma palmae J233]|uniref:DNA polymerase I n=1 Tax=Alteracholeplasma palmae (strain ATCC 49389 / J233) TaxID=1318466 RepID=U4KRD1_ALTPJ|nr:DNA polymerase I [Alteracholeplasma palmae]CCV64056.1 DNA polymerase I [Alteracholeplasma palmae J233]